MLGVDTFSQTSFDSIPTFPAAYFTNVAESTTSSDSLSATAYFYTTTTDSISTTDSDLGNFNFYETVSESYTSADNYNGIFNAYPTNAESFTSSDTIDAVFAYLEYIDETLLISDSPTGNAYYNGIQIAETTNNTDAYVGFRGQFPIVSETITFTDTALGPAAFNPYVVDALLYNDQYVSNAIFLGDTNEVTTIVTALLNTGWAKVNDSQNPNWTAINNTQ